MKIILRDFFGFLLALGKKIVIISDMGRKEHGVWHYEAGVELFNLIYNEYGMSTKAIIFTGDDQKAKKAIENHGINPGNWSVTTDTAKVIEEALAEFKK